MTEGMCDRWAAATAAIAWRAKVADAFARGREAEAVHRAELEARLSVYRDERAAAARRATDDAADREAEAEWQRARGDNEVMGYDD
jgi:hypothetical protein